MQKKTSFFRRFWVKEPRHSETFSDEKCHLGRSPRLQGFVMLRTTAVRGNEDIPPPPRPPSLRPPQPSIPLPPLPPFRPAPPPPKRGNLRVEKPTGQRLCWGTRLTPRTPRARQLCTGTGNTSPRRWWMQRWGSSPAKSCRCPRCSRPCTRTASACTS